MDLERLFLSDGIYHQERAVFTSCWYAAVPGGQGEPSAVEHPVCCMRALCAAADRHIHGVAEAVYQRYCSRCGERIISLLQFKKRLEK